MAQVGRYEAADSAALNDNLANLDKSSLLWFDQDISTDEKVLELMRVSDQERDRLTGISQDAPGGGGKNPEWLSARFPSGIWRQTGSAIDRARRKQPSHLKSQVGVAPDGTPVPTYNSTADMQYGTLHEPDAFAGIKAWFPVWFENEYCRLNMIDHSKCGEPTYESTNMGIFVWGATPSSPIAQTGGSKWNFLTARA